MERKIHAIEEAAKPKRRLVTNQRINIVNGAASRLVKSLDESDPTNKCLQVITAYLGVDGEPFEPLSSIGKRVLEEPFYAGVVDRACLVMHVKRIEETEGLSTHLAIKKAREFKELRAKTVKKQTAANLGADFYRWVQSHRDTPWNEETNISLVENVMNSDNWYEGGNKSGKPDWERIGSRFGVTAEAARQHYSALIEGVKDGRINGGILEKAEEVGIYESTPQFSWSEWMPYIDILIEDDEECVWKKGGNKGQPKWGVILVKLQGFGILSQDIDLSEESTLSRYKGLIKAAYQTRKSASV